jgi:hypothetical protein
VLAFGGGGWFNDHGRDSLGVAAAVVEGEKPRAHDANANDHRDNLSMGLEAKEGRSPSGLAAKHSLALLNRDRGVVVVASTKERKGRTVREARRTHTATTAAARERSRDRRKMRSIT